MVTKKSQPKVEPFGDTLDAGVALLQSANALDLASIIAHESKDSGRLVEIAQVWVMVANRLIDGPARGEEEGPDELETETEPTDKEFKMGFIAKEIE